MDSKYFMAIGETASKRSLNWTRTEAIFVSHSHNEPFLPHPFTGRPLGVVANDKVMLHRSLTQ